MGNLGRWVAENHADWCRLILWLHQDIELFSEEAIHSEEPTENYMSWKVMELQGWLHVRRIKYTSKDTKVVLQGSASTCLDAESGPPVPMPPGGGSCDFGIETATALSILIRAVMKKVVTQEIIDQVDVSVKRLLCAVDRINTAMSDHLCDNYIPLWLKKYKFLHLLNLTQMLYEYGSIKIIHFFKKLIQTTQGSLAFVAHVKFYQQRSLGRVKRSCIAKSEDNYFGYDEANENEEKQYGSMEKNVTLFDFHVYSDSESDRDEDSSQEDEDENEDKNGEDANSKIDETGDDYKPKMIHRYPHELLLRSSLMARSMVLSGHFTSLVSIRCT
jgi:hypothetical protein